MPTCPRPAGARQFVETNHFTLYTNLSEPAAKAEGKRLEQLLFALRTEGWEEKGDLPLRMNVIMFKDADDFKPYSDGFVGGFTYDKVLFEPWIVLTARQYGQSLDLVAHEQTVRGDRAGAIESCRRAQSLQPTNSQFLIARAEVLAHLSACRELRQLAAQLDTIGHERLSTAQREWFVKAARECREPSQ